MQQCSECLLRDRGIGGAPCSGRLSSILDAGIGRYHRGRNCLPDWELAPVGLHFGIHLQAGAQGLVFGLGLTIIVKLMRIPAGQETSFTRALAAIAIIALLGELAPWPLGSRR